jgi:hypothetical protein
MPQVGFVCPDGGTITHDECLAHRGCRLRERCATIPTLKRLSIIRQWHGKPSVTQLIKGTREAYLDIITPYNVAPDDAAFRLHGTLHHEKMEAAALNENALPEETFDEDVKGTPDLLEQDEYADNGGYVLVDYKTWGSYKAAKALGIYTQDEDTGEFFKSGPRKGQPKTRKVARRDAAHIDMWETELQLNRYRQFYEGAGFKPINRLLVQISVRDGGTRAAISYGITRKIYYPVAVKFLDDAVVKEYFDRKRDALLAALAAGKIPPPCDERERWDGNRKCLRFCSVNFACPFYQEIKPAEEGDDDNS